MTAALLFIAIFPVQATAADNMSAEDAFCGARALQAVLDHLGRKERFDDLVLELGGIAGTGSCSIGSLAQAFQRRTIPCRAIWLDPELLTSLRCPAIIHLSPQPPSTVGHFVALMPASNSPEKLVPVDAATSYGALGINALQPRFSGAVLLITDTGTGELGLTPFKRPFEGSVPMFVALVCLFLLFCVRSWPRLARVFSHLFRPENVL